MDFFFAQLFIIYLSLYFVEFDKDKRWIQWILIFVGAFAIAILLFLFPTELYVQAGVVAVCFGALIIYWIIYYFTIGNHHLPKYDWICVAIGFGLIAISVMMFSVQNDFPQYYWAAHAVWHAAAAMGFHFIIMIKPPMESIIYNVAERIKFS
jgi:hypothetical protein